MTRYRQNAQKYLSSKMGRYVDLRHLPFVELAGVVLHDDVGVFERAFAKTASRDRGKTKFSLLTMNSGGRFSPRVVLYRGKCVLLIGTGMGCTGTSIVAHELGFRLRRPKVRIIKIGTCVSVHPAYPVETVLVPRWAVADEGSTAWDVRMVAGLGDLESQITKVFVKKDVVGADERFRSEWQSHLARKKSLYERIAAERPEAMIWSTDAFYPLMARPDFF